MDIADREDAYRIKLPSDGFTVIRLDGVGFSKFTKKFEKPFAPGFTTAMGATAQELFNFVPSTVLAYSQSDEISLILDHCEPRRQPWYGNNINKLTSVTAALASVEFAQWTGSRPLFDSRAFYLPTPDDVMEYLIVRQNNARVNAVSMIAQTCASTLELKGMNVSDRLKLIQDRRGTVLDDYPDKNTRGLVIQRTKQHHSGWVMGTDDVLHEIDTFRKGSIENPAPYFTTLTYKKAMAPVILEPISEINAQDLV